MESCSSSSSQLSKRELRNNRFFFKRSVKRPKKNAGNTKVQTVQTEIKTVENDRSASDFEVDNFQEQEDIEFDNRKEEEDIESDSDNQQEQEVAKVHKNRENMNYEDESEDNSRNVEIPDAGVAAAADAADAGNVREENEKNKNKKRFNELKKDIAAVNDRIEPLLKVWKTIKSIIKRRGGHHFDSPGVSEDEDDEEFDQLPRFPLLKVKHVLLMQENIGNNKLYKKQLIAKLRTIGGSTIKNNVIRIFKKIFSIKLRTKFTLRGSVIGKKAAFEDLDNILSVLRQAVKHKHKTCSADDIEAEVKLRFKQAPKDYNRFLLKQQ